MKLLLPGKDSYGNIRERILESGDHALCTSSSRQGRERQSICHRGQGLVQGEGHYYVLKFNSNERKAYTT